MPPRRVLAAPRLRAAGMLVAGLAGLLWLYAVDPSRSHLYPVCPFHLLTGLECPGCGGLRALHALLHGRLEEALHFNAYLVGFALPLAALVGIDRGLRRLGRRVLLTEAWQARLLWAGLAALIAFGILRNLPLAALASLRA